MEQEFQPAQQPIQPEPVAPIKRPSSPIVPMAIVAGVLILIGFVGLLFVERQQTAGPTPTLTPTPSVSSVQNQSLSPIATQSAFLQFEASVATLSSAIAAYSPIDQTLIPPALVLPLGY